MVYELNNWQDNPRDSLTLKNILLVAVKLTINAIKSEPIYNGQGIAFDGAGEWSYDNDFA